MNILKDTFHTYIYGAENENSDDEAQRRYNIVKKWALSASIAVAVFAFSSAAVELLGFTL